MVHTNLHYKCIEMVLKWMCKLSDWGKGRCRVKYYLTRHQLAILYIFLICVLLSTYIYKEKKITIWRRLKTRNSWRREDPRRIVFLSGVFSASGYMILSFRHFSGFSDNSSTMVACSQSEYPLVVSHTLTIIMVSTSGPCMKKRGANFFLRNMANVGYQMRGLSFLHF